MILIKKDDQQGQINNDTKQESQPKECSDVEGVLHCAYEGTTKLNEETIKVLKNSFEKYAKSDW